jgi:chromosomal replication initiation ATPase DnaA
MKQEEINKIVCDYFGIETIIEKPGRFRKFAHQRHIAQYLGRIFCDNKNLTYIGEKTGKSHCTVSYASKKIMFLVEKKPCFDEELKTDIENLKFIIKHKYKL